MTDFRALCAELTDKLSGYASANPYHDSDALVVRARAALAEPEPKDDVALLREALAATAAQRRAEDDARAALAADGPAVPEGREPASVVGEPSDEELAQAAKAAIHDYKYPTELGYFLDSDSSEYEPFLLALRAVIAADRARWGHQPAPPAEGEVEARNVAGLFRRWADAYPDSVTVDPQWLTRAADLLEQRYPAPVPVPKGPTRDDLWELWLRLNNELPDRPAAVAEFWEHAQIDARARAALAELEPVAWLWEYIGSDPYPHRLSPVARSPREMDPANPPFPNSWRPVAPLYALPLPQQETTND